MILMRESAQIVIVEMEHVMNPNYIISFLDSLVMIFITKNRLID